jgi:hypothetical protein
MKLRFAHTADITDIGADQSLTLDVVAPLGDSPQMATVRTLYTFTNTGPAVGGFAR